MMEIYGICMMKQLENMLLDSMTFQAEGPDEWNFPIVDGISARVVNVPDMLDTLL